MALSPAEAYDVREVNTRAKPKEARAPRKTANGVMREMNKTLEAEITEFGRWLIEHLETLRRGAETNRERESFTKRYTRNLDRDRALVSPSFTADGGVSKTGTDGHAVMGIQQGWSHQGRQVASDYFYSRIFGSTQRWWRLQPRGRTKEGPLLAKVFSDMVAHCLRTGNFDVAAVKSTDETPRHGTCPIRYRMGRNVIVTRDEDGNYVETVTDLIPSIRCWPLDHTYPTRLDSNDQQEGYFFVTPSTTLSRLEREEAMFEFMDEGGNIVVKVAGRFRNLYPLREDLKNIARSYNKDHQRGQVSINNREDVLHVSHQHQFTLVEWEGPLPMAAAVAEGKMTPRIAKFFSIDMGFDPEGEEELEDWGYALERIPVYSVSYILDPKSPKGKEGTLRHHVIELSPPQTRVDCPQVVETRYALDGNKYYGMSVTDLGWRLEDFGDQLRNHQAKIMAVNTDPSYGVDYRLTQNKKAEEVMKLIRGGGSLVSILGGADVTKIAQAFILDVDTAEIENLIAQCKFEFENVTGVTRIAKGNSSAPTATANQLEAGASDLRLGQVARRNMHQYLKLVKWIVRDLSTMMTRDELIKYAARVSGVGAAALAKYLPSLDGIEEQFDYMPGSTIVPDPALAITVMNRTAQLFPQAIKDPTEYFGLVMDLIGVPGADQITVVGTGALEPDEEHLLMAQGTWVDVHKDDDDQTHLLQHATTLERINAGQVIEGLNQKETEVLRQQLEAHGMMQLKQFQLKAQMQAYQQQLMAGPGGGGGQAAPGLGQGGGGGMMNAPGEPTRMEQDTSPATGAQLGQNIRERAGA